MATPPDFSVGQVLTAAQMNAVGLWKITPSSVTGGTIGSNGDVTVGTAVSTVTVSGVFSADYRNYKITLTGGSSTGFYIDMKLGATATNYYNVRTITSYAASTTLTGGGSNNGTVWSAVMELGTVFNHGNLELFNPYGTDQTVIQGLFTNDSGGGFVSGYLNDTTSYTAFTLVANGGTITGGVISIYGYN